jgi:biotin transport system ATP-binding protein
MKPLIEISTASHVFADGTIGLDRINLTIEAGELVAIAGPNGSGKTTLLMHINGLLTPDSGRIRLNGRDAVKSLADAQPLAGLVFQNADAQIVGETVAEDTAFGPENLCLSRDTINLRVKAALEKVGLSHLAYQRPHLLSGGEKKRLAIAGVLAMQPRIIMFDEPFAGLDYPGIKQVLAQIVTLHESGYTLIITTHDLEKIIAHTQRLIIMQKGSIVRDGAPEALLSDLEDFGVRKPCAARFGREALSWLS